MPAPAYGSGIISPQVSRVQALHTHTHTFGSWPANINTLNPRGLLLGADSHDILPPSEAACPQAGASG
jgi:hypothetical protein